MDITPGDSYAITDGTNYLTYVPTATDDARLQMQAKIALVAGDDFDDTQLWTVVSDPSATKIKNVSDDSKFLRGDGSEGNPVKIKDEGEATEFTLDTNDGSMQIINSQPVVYVQTTSANNTPSQGTPKQKWTWNKKLIKGGPGDV